MIVKPKPISYRHRPLYVINLSNHRLSQHVMSSITDLAKGKKVVTFNAIASFNCDQELEPQIEEILLTLGHTKISGHSPFDLQGEIYLFLPGLTAGGVLLFQAIEQIIGVAPKICLIGKERNGSITLRQVIDCSAQKRTAHKNFRKELVLK